MPWNANNNAPGALRAPGVQKAIVANRTCIVLKTVRSVFGNDTPSAFVHPDTKLNSDFMHPRKHGQCIVRMEKSDKVDVGCVMLSDIQKSNLELCDFQKEEWFAYDVGTANVADAISIRISLMEDEGIVMDYKSIQNKLNFYLRNHVISLNERFIVDMEHKQFLLQCMDIHAQDALETEYTMPDVFRAKIDKDTVFYIVDDVQSENFQILGLPQRIPKCDIVNENVVQVETSDEEMFPVKKKLLYPCIALTSAVQSGRGVHKDASNTISINVDCCTFDRVLLYLEHEVRGSSDNYELEACHAQSLLVAANTLGCIGLKDTCQRILGELESRVRKHAIRWEEVLAQNQNKNIWLVMQGMVFDVTRWLTEHPGGSTIIPQQALNMDCTVMFEIYHSSRQSFRYLKQFYIGEIAKHDLDLIPPSATGKVSDAFLETFDEYTKWRITPLEKTFKSF